jgi:hypothetical protein
MKKLVLFFLALSLGLLLSAPVALAGEQHSGELPPPPIGDWR